jgi:hypothetical protein
MDSIISAYHKMKNPLSKTKLPTLFDGRDESDDPMNEQYDDPWDVAEFKADILKTNQTAHVPKSCAEHDSAIRDVISKIGGLPKPDDLTLIHSMISTHPAKAARHHLYNTHITPLLRHMSNFEDENETSPWLTKNDLNNLKQKNDLKLSNGRVLESPDDNYNIRGALYLHDDGTLHKTSKSRLESRAFPEVNEDHLNMMINEHSDAAENASHHVRDYTEDSKEVNTHLGDKYNETETNRSMFKETPEELEVHANAISHDISKAPPLSKSFDVFTGVSKRTNIMAATNNGQKESIFHAPTFLSSSLKFSIAAGFAKEKHSTELEANHEGGVHDLLHIHVPEGFKGGMYVDSISRNKDELEYLFDHSHKFTIHPQPKYTASGGKLIRVWHARVHPK